MFRVARLAAVGAMALACALCAIPALAATSPTLYSVGPGGPIELAQGAQESWPVRIDEQRALDAIFQGGMWLPDPGGGRIYARYRRHVIHANGTWSWIGTVSTAHGNQSTVLTFGAHSVFGLVPRTSGYPLRIVTRRGETRVIETSGKALARSPLWLRLHARADGIVPPRARRPAGNAQRASVTSAAIAAQGADTTSVTIDVMVAYSSGFASSLGGTTPALTRIQNLVDITNQAYDDSNIHQQIRLVKTLQVDYADNTSNDSALDDLTGLDQNGNPVPRPASLQSIPTLRTQYGADLVVLLRHFNNASQGDCGVGWENGAGEVAIVPSQDQAWGFSVVSDGSDAGYFCYDTTFAHELGHNMGDAHDRANASGPGAYSYSYGYLGNGSNGFSTIMAYPTSSDTPLSVFSNPDISTCQNTPCGVPDDASDSADNAHSMNNTAALIAQFEPTMVGAPPPTVGYVHNDVDGDGRSDLIWYNPGVHQMTYWLMNGATKSSWREFPVIGGYQPLATGDFNGDGRAGILWTDARNNLYLWLNNGDGTFTNQFVAHYSNGWTVAGTADVDDDGNTDIFWYNKSAGQFTYWLMDGATKRSSSNLFVVSKAYWPVGFGDFDGNGHADVLWTDAGGDLYMWLGDGNGDGGFSRGNFIARYDSVNWQLAGVADVDGDGQSDLLWHSKKFGELTYWLMNGAARRASRLFPISTAYWPAGLGDFNGDGRADVLWVNANRDMYMWLGNADGSFSRGNFVARYGQGWTPLK